MSEEWVIKVESPPVQGQRVKDIQWLLSGHNRFNHQTYHGSVDGIFGSQTGAAAKSMKFYLGYPTEGCVETAGSTLRGYLIPPTSDDSIELPAAYVARKNERKNSLFSYPAPIPGTLIGFPGQGTHSFVDPPNNWESDRACDIALPVGTQMLACFAGTIGPQFGPLDSTNPRFAGLRLHLVRSDNKDEAYYAHLSKFAANIKPGVHVEPGQLLGYSGSANGVAHLHFALKVAYPPTFLKDTLNV